MNWVNVVVSALISLVLVVGSITVVSFLGDPFGIQKRKTETAISEAMTAKAAAATAEGQTGVAIDWAAIAQGATAREATVARIGNTNAQQIQKAEGANIILSDSLINSINTGLCHYESTPCPSSR